jgi:hypothetical protein
MMAEVNNPFQSEPFYLTSHKRTFTEYEADGTPKQPLGYATIREHSFDQEQGGGNWYFTPPGTRVFEGNGRVICGSGSAYHAPEFWRDDISTFNARLNYAEYGMVLLNLTLARRFEDHIPFKGVTFTWKIKKETVVTEQEFDLVQPSESYPFWSSTPGQIVETERSEEEVTVTLQLPDDFEQNKHDFDSLRDLTDQQRIDRGFVFPKGGTFQDGSPKHGFDSRKEVTELNLYPYPPPDESLTYDVTTKITVTTITYKTPGFYGDDAAEETCTPAPFYTV